MNQMGYIKTILHAVVQETLTIIISPPNFGAAGGIENEKNNLRTNLSIGLL